MVLHPQTIVYFGQKITGLARADVIQCLRAEGVPDWQIDTLPEGDAGISQGLGFLDDHWRENNSLVGITWIKDKEGDSSPLMYIRGTYHMVCMLCKWGISFKPDGLNTTLIDQEFAKVCQHFHLRYRTPSFHLERYYHEEVEYDSYTFYYGISGVLEFSVAEESEPAEQARRLAEGQKNLWDQTLLFDQDLESTAPKKPPSSRSVRKIAKSQRTLLNFSQPKQPKKNDNNVPHLSDPITYQIPSDKIASVKFIQDNLPITMNLSRHYVTSQEDESRRVYDLVATDIDRYVLIGSNWRALIQKVAEKLNLRIYYPSFVTLAGPIY